MTIQCIKRNNKGSHCSSRTAVASGNFNPCFNSISCFDFINPSKCKPRLASQEKRASRKSQDSEKTESRANLIIDIFFASIKLNAFSYFIMRYIFAVWRSDTHEMNPRGERKETTFTVFVSSQSPRMMKSGYSSSREI